MRTFLFVILTLALALPRGAWGASGKTEATWLGHAAWLIKTPGGAQLLIDPWIENPKCPKDFKLPATLDAILITHGHFDHVGQAAEIAKKTGAQVMGSYELVGQLGLADDKAAGGNAGGSLKIKDVTISMTEAVHSSGYGKPGEALRYGGVALGFVVAVDGGPTFYHAGDTDVFSSMALIGERYHPTVAMLPIGGHFTIGPAGAALAAKLLQVKTVLPMHYGTFPVLTGTPDELKKIAPPGVKVLTPKPGDVSLF